MMFNKVIIFCALSFYSNIADSVPLTTELPRNNVHNSRPSPQQNNGRNWFQPPYKTQYNQPRSPNSQLPDERPNTPPKPTQQHLPKNLQPQLNFSQKQKRFNNVPISLPSFTNVKENLKRNPVPSFITERSDNEKPVINRENSWRTDPVRGVQHKDMFWPKIPSTPPKTNISPDSELLILNKQSSLSNPAVREKKKIHWENPANLARRSYARASNLVEQVTKPLKPNYNIEEIIAKAHTHNAITPSSQKKLYLVVYPNGTMEHADSLQLISQRYPNFILVKSKQNIPRRKTTISELANVTVPFTNESGNIKKKNISSPVVAKYNNISSKPEIGTREHTLKLPAATTNLKTIDDVHSSPRSILEPKVMHPHYLHNEKNTKPLNNISTNTSASKNKPERYPKIPNNETKSTLLPLVTPNESDIRIYINDTHSSPQSTLEPKPIHKLYDLTHQNNTKSLILTNTSASKNEAERDPTILNNKTKSSKLARVQPESQPKSEFPANKTSLKEEINPNTQKLQSDTRNIFSHNNTAARYQDENVKSYKEEKERIELLNDILPKDIQTQEDLLLSKRDAKNLTNDIPAPTKKAPNTINLLEKPATEDPDTKVKAVAPNASHFDGVKANEPNETASAKVLATQTKQQNGSVSKIEDQASISSIESSKSEIIHPKPRGQTRSSIDIFEFHNNNIRAHTDDENDNDLNNLEPENYPVWYDTLDPDFWAKVTEGSKDSAVYIFDISHMPKIENNITKTIHPNGTIIEEISSHVWEINQEEPTIKKTVNIYHPEEI